MHFSEHPKIIMDDKDVGYIHADHIKQCNFKEIEQLLNIIPCGTLAYSRLLKELLARVSTGKQQDNYLLSSHKADEACDSLYIMYDYNDDESVYYHFKNVQLTTLAVPDNRAEQSLYDALLAVGDRIISEEFFKERTQSDILYSRSLPPYIPEPEKPLTEEEKALIEAELDAKVEKEIFEELRQLGMDI